MIICLEFMIHVVHLPGIARTEIFKRMKRIVIRLMIFEIIKVKVMGNVLYIER